MLDCFEGLVTLNDTCESGTPGVLSLQTIGINETLLAQITNSEETPATLLANCETLARNVLARDLGAAFSDRIVPRTFVEAQAFGVPYDAQELQSYAAGSSGGFVVEIDKPNTNAILHIGMLGAWLDATTTLQVSIYDVANGQLLQTADIDCVAGEISTQSIQIELGAYRRKRVFYIAHSALTAYRTTIAESGCHACGNAGWLHGGVHVWGARLAAALPVKRTNLQNTSHSSGLLMQVTVECDHAQFFCEVKNTLALPYLYKLGQTIVERAIYAFERLNSQTINKEELHERRDRLGAEYVEAMKNTVGRMRLPDDSLCYLCNQRTRSTIALP